MKSSKRLSIKDTWKAILNIRLMISIQRSSQCFSTTRPCWNCWMKTGKTRMMTKSLTCSVIGWKTNSLIQEMFQGSWSCFPKALTPSTIWMIDWQMNWAEKMCWPLRQKTVIEGLLLSKKTLMRIMRWKKTITTSSLHQMCWLKVSTFIVPISSSIMTRPGMPPALCNALDVSTVSVLLRIIFTITCFILRPKVTRKSNCMKTP